MSDAQLRQAAELMDQFNRAAGNDAALRAVCAGIHAAAGITDFQDLLARGEQDLDIAAPSEVKAQLAATALPALRALPPDRPVIGNRSGELMAGDLALIAAQRVVDLDRTDPVITPELARLARQTLDGPAALR
jgi:hypothetical protein